MNFEQAARAVPPPIPEGAKKKGPPPIPEAAKKRSSSTEEIPGEQVRIVNIADIEKKPKGPPPIPEAARKQKFENIQAPDVVEAFEVNGYNNMEVTGTLEKKDVNKEGTGPNEDTVLFDPAQGLIGALDGAGGMGGRPDLAAKVASQTIPKLYGETLKTAPSGVDLQNALVEQMLKRLQGKPEERVAVTNMIENMMSQDPMIAKKAYALIEAVKKSNDAVKETKGATMAIVAQMHDLPDGSKIAIIVNTGDAGAMKRRADGTLKSLVPEDSLFTTMKDKGILSEEKLKEMKTVPDQKFKFGKMDMSYKDIMRTATGGLGLNEPTPSLTIELVRPGEELYLGSDGLFDKFDDPETDELNIDEMSLTMADEVGKDGAIKPTDLKTKLNRMRSEAKARKTYKKDDDVSIVGVRVNAKK